MRRLLIAVLLVLSFAVPVRAATLDPGQITAIDTAADAFVAKAAEAKKTGVVPRQSDPAIAALLDTVFDTRALSHGALPYADYDKLHDWLKKAGDVGAVYVVASRAAHDAGLFAPEMERYFAAIVVILQAMADCAATELDTASEKRLPAAELHQIDEARRSLAENLANIVRSLRDPGLTLGAVERRLAVLTTAAPSFARLLKPADVERLRRETLGLSASFREKPLRAGLGSFATALAAPRAPIAPPAEAAAGNGEIALDYDGREYTVPVRINGVKTVKFVVDSGASVVTLPKDLVEELTKSGVIGDGEMHGRNTYVTADGKHHHGTWLTLRQLDVGGHTVTNVIASVAPVHADPLLGQTFLAKFKSWTLDNKRHVLILGE